MTKAGDKSSTSDQIGTEPDEEIAWLFKPKSRKTRSTDDPQVKHAQRKAVSDAVEKFKAGHRVPRMMSISLREKPERRKKTKWRALFDRDREREQCERLAAGVIEAGLHAGELMEEAVGRDESSREYFRRLAELLDHVGSNGDPLPKIVVKQLASLCHYLSDGIIPGPIKHCALSGRPLGPDERRDACCAVAYVMAARAGLIRDPHWIKTIMEKYGLQNRTVVQGWVGKHGSEILNAVFADPDVIRDRMEEAGARYRLCGRHPQKRPA